jgi:hypothetical protein
MNTTLSNDGPVYKGMVIDQTIVTTEQGDTRVILTVKHTARLKDSRDLAAGSDSCSPTECEVWITLAADNDKQLRMALRALERLGFADDDVSRLHADHPEGVSLVNTEVHVRAKVVDEVEYWNLVWPRARASLDTTRQAAAQLKDKIAALRAKGGRHGPDANVQAEGPS